MRKLCAMALDMPMDLPDFDTLWDYGKPAETELKFREILAMYGSTADSTYTFELMTQIARTLGLQQKFDEAHKFLDEVETALAEERGSAGASPSREAWDRVHVRYLLERGRVCNSAKGRKKHCLYLSKRGTLLQASGSMVTPSMGRT